MPGDILNQLRDAENHPIRAFVLHNLPVELERYAQLPGIGDEGRRQEIRPHGQEGGRAFAYEPIRADRFQIRTEDFVAAGQVVDDRIAGDVAHRVRLCDMPAPAAQ